MCRYHGMRKINENGETFCPLNELSIMNLMLEKADVHKNKWQDSLRLNAGCTDLIVMQQLDIATYLFCDLLSAGPTKNQGTLKFTVHHHCV